MRSHGVEFSSVGQRERRAFSVLCRPGAERAVPAEVVPEVCTAMKASVPNLSNKVSRGGFASSLWSHAAPARGVRLVADRSAQPVAQADVLALRGLLGSASAGLGKNAA